MKVQITEERQPCRHCGMPVQKKVHRSGWKPKKNQPYYFKWWFVCPGCGASYLVEEAKVWLVKPRVREPNIDDQYKMRMAMEEE